MCTRDPSFAWKYLQSWMISRSGRWLQILTKLVVRSCGTILYFYTLYFQPLQLPPGEWPSQVIFDQRPHYEHIAYMVMSQRESRVFSTSNVGIGSLCRYNVQDQTILQQLSGVICMQCLCDGEQLLVMQTEKINPDDPDKIVQLRSVFVLDSASFTPLLKFRDNHNGEGLLHQMRLCPRKAALYSSDFKTISFFTWNTDEMNRLPEVLILSLGKTCLSLMTLRESSRATILQHVRAKDLVYLPLPESLRNFLHGF